MKENIKQILREGIEKNELGVLVSRPTQELIIMVGISGSGKSTKAKELVGEGIIHSTDDVIESQGDYNTFFKLMVESKDFKPLSIAHSTNLKNSTNSIKEGITPCIIDNTNLTKSEMKEYVKIGLELGLPNNNIKFINIGTGGLLAEDLAIRNSHGVPLEKIKQMIQKYNSLGELTLKSVLESKDMFKESNVLYSAVVLDNGSKSALLSRVGKYIPEGWKEFAHHMTIVFGKGVPNKEDLGKEVTLYVEAIGLSDIAMAVKVEGYPSANAIPHITIAINPEGGKPKDSNDITKWQKIKNFAVKGIVTEIKKTE